MVSSLDATLGQTVEAGQALMTITPYVEPVSSPTELAARIGALEEQRDASADIDRQLALQQAAKTAQAKAELARTRAEVDAAQQRVTTMTALSDQLRRAQAEGVVSQRELLDQQQQEQDARVDLTAAQRRMAAARTALDALTASRDVELSQRELESKRMEGDLEEARASLASMSEDAQRDANEALTVRAPHDGVVVGLQADRAGVVVERGQPLLTLARLGTRMRAEIQVPERGAARVEQGATVRLLFDAYPYTRHGVVKGILTWVSPAAKEGQLLTFARLEDVTIVVDEKRRPLLPGMTGEARIDVGSRTLLEYVFEPLRQLHESLQPGSTEAG
jgi:HlyD family secretion protein